MYHMGAYEDISYMLEPVTTYRILELNTESKQRCCIPTACSDMLQVKLIALGSQLQAGGIRALAQLGFELMELTLPA